MTAKKTTKRVTKATKAKKYVTRNPKSLPPVPCLVCGELQYHGRGRRCMSCHEQRANLVAIAFREAVAENLTTAPPSFTAEIAVSFADATLAAMHALPPPEPPSALYRAARGVCDNMDEAGALYPCKRALLELREAVAAADARRAAKKDGAS